LRPIEDVDLDASVEPEQNEERELTPRLHATIPAARAQDQIGHDACEEAGGQGGINVAVTHLELADVSQRLAQGGPLEIPHDEEERADLENEPRHQVGAHAA